MSAKAVRALIADLFGAASALAMLGAELQSRITGRPVHPTLKPTVDKVLRGNGAFAALEGLTRNEQMLLLTELHRIWVLETTLMVSPEREHLWSHGDRDRIERSMAKK
ncbi:MAG TPA: hypothetical protein VJ826_08060 [Candidatus Polarisedimenticolaceae bacterium]|nr:hypothetical protein [Candidatus Polarisedimenticolaceae bacterium]